MVRGIGVESLFHDAGRHTHRHAARSRLDGLEVPLVDDDRA